MSQFTEKRTKGYHWEDCANKENAQFLAIAKVPILVARYAGSPILLVKVDSLKDICYAACGPKMKKMILGKNSSLIASNL